MATITYVGADGTTTVLEVDPGDTVMRGAVLNGVDGILAQCGGGASCGTCHVYVEAVTARALPALHAVEDELLHGTAAPRRPESRLSCQLPAAELDGLVVHLPDRQV
jgi:2Fe-2S ferredoxin